MTPLKFVKLLQVVVSEITEQEAITIQQVNKGYKSLDDIQHTHIHGVATRDALLIKIDCLIYTTQYEFEV